MHSASTSWEKNVLLGRIGLTSSTLNVKFLIGSFSLSLLRCPYNARDIFVLGTVQGFNDCNTRIIDFLVLSNTFVYGVEDEYVRVRSVNTCCL